MKFNLFRKPLSLKRISTMKSPCFAPAYCALYPGLAEITRRHGWALCIHGTLARDMDLTCIPWITSPSDPEEVLREITTHFALRLTENIPTQKEHGRLSYGLSGEDIGGFFIDLSFMPRIQADQYQAFGAVQ